MFLVGVVLGALAVALVCLWRPHAEPPPEMLTEDEVAERFMKLREARKDELRAERRRKSRDGGHDLS